MASDKRSGRTRKDIYRGRIADCKVLPCLPVADIIEGRDKTALPPCVLCVHWKTLKGVLA